MTNKMEYPLPFRESTVRNWSCNVKCQRIKWNDCFLLTLRIFLLEQLELRWGGGVSRSIFYPLSSTYPPSHSPPRQKHWFSFPRDVCLHSSRNFRTFHWAECPSRVFALLWCFTRLLLSLEMRRYRFISSLPFLFISSRESHEVKDSGGNGESERNGNGRRRRRS